MSLDISWFVKLTVLVFDAMAVTSSHFLIVSNAVMLQDRKACSQLDLLICFTHFINFKMNLGNASAIKEGTM